MNSPSELELTDPGVVENEQDLHSAGENYTVDGNTSLTARFTRLSISLADDADNMEILDLNHGKTAYSVILTGRKLSGRPSVKGIYTHHGRKEVSSPDLLDSMDWRRSVEFIIRQA